MGCSLSTGLDTGGLRNDRISLKPAHLLAQRAQAVRAASAGVL